MKFDLYLLVRIGFVEDLRSFQDEEER